MKVLAFLVATCAIVYGATIPKLQPHFGERIIDGEIADIKDVPYQVALLRAGQQSCGGSIISQDWILTAAHCTIGASANQLSIRAGSEFSNTGGIVHKVIRNIVHPKYNKEVAYDYDFALLELENPLPLGTPGVNSIPLASEDPSGGEMALIAGWGQTNRGVQLLKVNIPVVDRETCQENYGSHVISLRMMCAGWPEGGRNTCYGDSGGPLVAGGKQVGIVSRAMGCATKGYPTVFGDVAAVRAWISGKTGV